MKMNYKEIIEKLEEKLNIDEFAYEDVDMDEIGIHWEEIEQVGGEGKGDHWYSVKYFKDHDVYIKVTGWYSSYVGTEFNDWGRACEEVRPQEKVITVYE